MKPRVYVIPASPPCLCVERALQLKGLAYDVTELPNVLHVPFQLARFGRSTVPAMRVGGEKVVTSPAIHRRLDALAADPPLYPSPEVAEVEEWVVEHLQPIARQAMNLAAVRDPSSAMSLLEQRRVPMPAPMIRLSIPVISRLGARRNAATAESVAEALRAMPGLLDRVDAWIDAGVLGGEQANAADLQVGSNLAGLLRLGDFEPAIRAHERAAAIADRWFPGYPGRVPAGVLV